MATKNEFDVQDYEFQSFSVNPIENSNVEDFDMPELDGMQRESKKNQVKVLKQERESARQTGFKIQPEVLHHRGIDKNDREERESIIADEIEKRLKKIGKETYDKAYQDGLQHGKEEVFKELMSQTEEKLNILTEMINEAILYKEDLLAKQKVDAYKLIKNLVKWVTLKELDGDEEYHNRLLDHLIKEIQCEGRVLIKINPKYFSSIPEIQSKVEETYEGIQNVKVEMDDEMDEFGIILESDNGIIDGTLEKQFDALDKIFEKMGVSLDKNTIPKMVETEDPESIQENIVDVEKEQKTEDAIDSLDDEDDEGNEDA